MEALVAAEASGSVQGLGAGRACSGCLHVGGDNLIVGTPEFLFLPSGTKEHQESVRFRWQRRNGFPLLIHTRYFSVKRMAGRLFSLAWVDEPETGALSQPLDVVSCS